ncbi:MAG: hypothetical protein QNK36_04230 [Colwellia sp.]|nr:hypothetical protein [Colwellia sp.]
MENTFKDFEFFVLAPNDWNGQRMNRQQLFSRVAQYSPVVYSKGLKHSWELGKKSLLLANPISRFEEYEDVLVDQPSSLLVRIKKWKLYDRIVLRIHAYHLARKKDNKKKSVLYIFHPQFVDYVRTFEYDILVYHPFDDFSKQGEVSISFIADESYLVQNADLVITPSLGVTNNLKDKYQRSDIKTVHNGVDYHAFAQYAKQNQDLPPQNNKHKRVGYVGSINQKVDIDLLIFLACNFPEVSFEFVGPVGSMGNKASAFEELSKMANVKLHGSKPYQELPKITAEFDCLLMCYDTSDKLWAGLAYPLKLNEYLAVKVPVISCDLPSVPFLNTLVDVASTHDSWAQCLTEIFAGNYSKQNFGFEYASDQDWDARVAEIATLLHGIK